MGSLLPSGILPIGHFSRTREVSLRRLPYSPLVGRFRASPSVSRWWFRSGFTARSSGCLTDLIGGRYVVPTRQSARLRRKAQTSSINGVHHLRPGVVEIGNLRFLATDGARAEKRRHRLFVGEAKKLITSKIVKGEIYKFHL